LAIGLWQTTTEDKLAREIIQPRAPGAGYIPAFGSPIFVASDDAASNLPSGSVLARLLHVWNQKMTKSGELYRNAEALATTDRDRHEQLSRKLREARVETAELLDGFEFRLRSEIVSLVDLAEWISLERRCCPFLQFEVNFPRRDGVISWGLTLRGREGVKHFIRSALHI
jgi:hypothetical protein